MLTISRFRVAACSEQEFVARARTAVEFFSRSTGNRHARLVRNLDDRELWAIITDWDSVGDYRRSFSGFEAKATLVPLLGEAIDEPSAFDDPDQLGDNVPRVT